MMTNHNQGAEIYAHAQRPNGQSGVFTATKTTGRMRQHPTLWNNYKSDEYEAYHQIGTSCTVSAGSAQTPIACGFDRATPQSRIFARLLCGIPRLEVGMRRVRCWLCRMLCGNTFTNADAGREIDRLSVHVERLIGEITRLTSTHKAEDQ